MTTTHGHAPSLKAYYITYVALLVLLVATVGCAYLHLGKFNIVVAMFIASVKAGLVLWYFMHLKETPKIAHMYMGAAVITLAIGAVLFMSDYIVR